MPSPRRFDLTLEDGLAVRRYSGAGAPALWIHGLGESSRCFDAIVAHPRLADRAHVLVDLPGYGRAPWTDARSLDATVDHLASWLRAPAIVIGHSLGGVIATLLAERAPLVRAVIDVEGNSSLGDCTFSSQIAAYTEDDFAARGHDLLTAKLAAESADPALRGYAASMAFADPHQLWRHAVDLVALSRTETLPSRRAALGQRLTFLAGAPRGICARSRDLLAAAGVPLHDLAPAGHWPFLDQPDPFAALVATALDR